MIVAMYLAFSVFNLHAESLPQVPTDFILPLQSNDKIYLVTEAGGKSPIYTKEEGYYDSFHASDKAYYSLDFDVGKGGKANVVAVDSGKVVAVVYEGKYQHITVDHGNGYLTEYAEFDIDKKFKVGDKVGKGDKLGILSGKPVEHLHFQVKYSETGEHGTGLSKRDNRGLEGVKIAGVPLTDYKLKDKNGVPQSTDVVDVLKSANMSSAAKQISSQQINSSAQIALQDFEKITKTAHTTPMQVVNLLPDKDKVAQQTPDKLTKQLPDNYTVPLKGTLLWTSSNSSSKPVGQIDDAGGGGTITKNGNNITFFIPNTDPSNRKGDTLTGTISGTSFSVTGGFQSDPLDGCPTCAATITMNGNIYINGKIMSGTYKKVGTGGEESYTGIFIK